MAKTRGPVSAAGLRDSASPEKAERRASPRSPSIMAAGPQRRPTPRPVNGFGHTNAEDSLLTRSRHSGHGDAEAVDGKLVVNEDEATQVREIFRLYDEHRSLLETAEVLNARGWRTKRWNAKTSRRIGGLPWDKKGVSRVLTNVLYLG
jgi:hypothetical protein